MGVRGSGRTSLRAGGPPALLRATEPDCVVTTYPLYAPLIQQLYRDHSERPFRLISVVTDSITANSIWWRAPSYHLIVSNEATAEVLRAGGVPADKVKALGFPVSPRFADLKDIEVLPPEPGTPRRILVIVNHNKKKAARTIDELLELPDTHLTVTVGRDAELKAKLAERTRKVADRVTLLGWTNVMPRLLVDSHLVVTKAGGATVQEAIAQIHAQGGLAVASHPHVMKSEWGKNTLYLWENQERFEPLIDAWEIANRNDLFTPVGHKRLRFIANSDFHKPKHIESWKTLLHCDKDPEAVKECIRENRHVAITFYRDDGEKRMAEAPQRLTMPAFAPAEAPALLAARV